MPIGKYTDSIKLKAATDTTEDWSAAQEDGNRQRKQADDMSSQKPKTCQNNSMHQGSLEANWL